MNSLKEILPLDLTYAELGNSCNTPFVKKTTKDMN